LASKEKFQICHWDADVLTNIDFHVVFMSSHLQDTTDILCFEENTLDADRDGNRDGNQLSETFTSLHATDRQGRAKDMPSQCADSQGEKE
jgi:hypothetical protein